MEQHSNSVLAVVAMATALVTSACGSGDSGGTNAGIGGTAGSSGDSGNGGASSGTGGSGTGGANGGAGQNGSSGTASGGVNAGGAANDGGAPNGDGGTNAGGTTNAGGASTGGASTGGTANTGGANGGTGGASGGTVCKRGIATNTAPGAAFFPNVAWWYNWAIQPSGTDVGVEFVPMVWGTGSLGATLPAGSKFLLTFNEPNFKSQSNLTAADAASHWPEVEAMAATQNLPIVGPAMNYCGPAANCNGTSPYQYLKDFFAACPSCKVDYVAVHWYNCDLPSLKDYLEPGGNLEGFEQFGKPIWLTEFSCDGSASVAQQEAYMRAAVPYLEENPHVFRYSWFSAGPIPNARLTNADGSPTDLGKVYIDLAPPCP